MFCLTPNLKQDALVEYKRDKITPVVPRSECSLLVNQTFGGDIVIYIEVLKYL